MKILAHRGLWRTPAEHNTLASLSQAFRLGFGVETDIRDQGGKIVVAHDPPVGSTLPLAELLDAHASLAPHVCLALNIKSDGLDGLLERELSRFPSADYFTFDASVPDSIRYLRRGMAVFTRHSDVEPEPACYRESAGVWLDELTRPWIEPDIIARHLSADKRVCIVSPELHGRPHLAMWARLKAELRHSPTSGLLLCTDHPREAEEFFHA